MKKEYKAIIFVLAIMFANAPFAFTPTKGSVEEDSNPKNGLVTQYSNILLSGSGQSNLIKSSASQDPAPFDPSTIISFEMPILTYYHDYEDSPVPPGPISIAPPETPKEGYVDLSAKYNNGQPTVLIYHTHTTEAYDAGQNAMRSKDPQIGVVAVGSVIAKTLYDEFGIESTQITDIFDDPEYDGAYQRSQVKIEEALAKYPSIKYMFDVHRDSAGNSEAARAAFICEINGVTAAKVELVLGMAASYAPENKKFASEIEEKLLDAEPKLYKRTVEYSHYKYNQFIQPNSVLIEIGSDLTTPKEAQYTAAIVGRAIGMVIKGKEGR